MKFIPLTFLLDLAVVAVASVSLHAETTPTNYGRKLIERLADRNPALASVTLHAVPPGETASRIVATTGADIGRPSSDGDLLALHKDRPVVATVAEATRVSLPLRDVANRTVGLVQFDFSPAGRIAETDAMDEAVALRNALRTFIPAQDRLFEKFIRGFQPGDTLAQRLVMQAAGSDRNLWVVALHAVPPGEKANVVIAANAPEQMGHESDEVDTDTAVSGRVVAQMFPLTHRMEVHMPLRRPDGRPIATLTTVCLWNTEAEASNFLVRSLRIRDEMEPNVPSFEALFKP